MNAPTRQEPGATSLDPTGTAARGELLVEGLSVGYGQAGGRVVQVVHEVDLSLRGGHVHGLAGESGCGKSTAALGAIGYRGRGAVILGGRAILAGRDLLTMDRSSLRRVWGREIAYLAQNAATALDPALSVKTHFAHVLRRHAGLGRDQLVPRTRQLLEMVEIPDAGRAIQRYPHEFSGGQQQRLALAIALACSPSVLILDEPTTGLDVTTQARISTLLTDLVERLGIAALYVSHDIALLASVASEIFVMYGGEIVERGPAREVTGAPQHPYTRALRAAVPSVKHAERVVGIPGEPPLEIELDACAFAPRCSFTDSICQQAHPALERLAAGHFARCARLDSIRGAVDPRSVLAGVRETVPRHDASKLLELAGVSCFYPSRGGDHAAVCDVSLAVESSGTLGVVGLSGSGKSTLLRAIVGLHPRTTGTMSLRGEPLSSSFHRRPRTVRQQIQIIFQDPGSSLNPRHRVERLVARPLELFRAELNASQRHDVVGGLLEEVRLPRRLLDRYPAELSGGQQQRVAIARAFAAEPALLLCDEITSSLDVSVQATVIELVRGLAEARGTAIVFVSHDLAVIRSVAHRAIVMRDGKVCEEAPAEQLFNSPRHDYTIELLSAIPDIGDPVHLSGAIGS